MIRSLLILLIVAPTSQAVVWNEGIQGELHWDEALFIGNYSVVLTDFSLDEARPSKVLLNLQEHNQTIENRAMQSGEWFEENDSIKVTVEQITCGEDDDEDPSAKIRVQLPAVADLSLILSGDRDEFQGGDDLRLKLNIENKGLVDAENLKIILDSVPPCLNARYRISRVAAGAIWDEKKSTSQIDPIKVNLKAPYLPEPTDLSVRVRAEYADSEGVAHESLGHAIFRISGPLQFHKKVEEVQDCPRNFYIINSMRNSGNRTLDLKISDSTGSDFKANSSLLWDIRLSPGETKIVSYRIEAKRMGTGLSLPAAQASYAWKNKSYTISSEMPVIDVYGPLIEAKRSIRPSKIKPGDAVTVSIEFSNVGNKKAAVIWEDPVPEEAEVVAGKANGSLRLSPNETGSSEYRLRVLKPGTIRIPSTHICYRDVRGRESYAEVRPQEIKVEAEKPIAIDLSDSNETAQKERTEDDGGSSAGYDAGNALLNEDDDRAGNEIRESGQLDQGAGEFGKGDMLITLLLVVALLSAAISKYS
jgi:hypothetical protein